MTRQEVEKSVEFVKEWLGEWGSSYDDETKEVLSLLISLAKSWLSCGEKLPEKYINLKMYDKPSEVDGFYNGKTHGFNEAIDSCQLAMTGYVKPLSVEEIYELLGIYGVFSNLQDLDYAKEEEKPFIVERSRQRKMKLATAIHAKMMELK